jgi:hypothetical protein
LAFVLTAASIGAGALWFAARTDHGQAIVGYLFSKARGGYTLEERMAAYLPAAERRMRPSFDAAGIKFPPGEVAYLAFKDTKRIEMYARADAAMSWRFVRDYAVHGLSGNLGPKLRDGDRQVPEGSYRAEYLNPNSRFHASIRLNYPNKFDRKKAAEDGRTSLGGDIMIHGTSSSVGCLAVGNEAAEDLFVLAGLVSKERVRIVISPTDLRVGAAFSTEGMPSWVGELHEALRAELQNYPTAVRRTLTSAARGSD